MSERPPVDVGAQFEVEPPGYEDPVAAVYRVTNIMIDEDGTSWLTIRGGDRLDEKVSYDDLMEAVDEGWAERVNSGHEAWSWREQDLREE